eukprot:g2071.t1
MPGRREDGRDGVLLMSTGEYWNETAQHHRPKKRGSSMSDLAAVPDIIPLDVLFTICSEKHGWLTIQDKKVTFLHSSDTSGVDKSVKFVVGCYLAYLGETDSDKSPVSSGSASEAHWKVNDKAFVGPQHPSSQLSQIMYSVGMDTNQITNYGGPAHKRYAQYFLSILYASNPPPKQSIALRVDKVIVSGLEQIKSNLRINRVLSKKWRDCVLHPVLVIYQKGKLKWKKIDSIFSFSPEVDVAGDCVVGIWFVKDCVSTNDPPVVAFSFHSAFMEPGEVRLSSADLTLLGVDINQILDSSPTTISMELTLAHSTATIEEVENWEPLMEHNRVHEHWLSERRGLPEIYATMTQSQCKQAAVIKEQKMKDIAPTKSLEKGIETLNRQSPSQEDVKTKTAAGNKGGSPFRLAGAKKAPPPPPPKKKPTPVRRLSSSASISRNKRVSKTKPLYWSITPKQSGTVWSELAPEDTVNDSRLSLLEDLFCKDDLAKPKITENETTETANHKKRTAVAVSVGRANNVSIMMTRFKRFSHSMEDLCKAILTGKGVTTDELILLSQISPTEGEARDLKEHDRDALSIPEQVLLAMTVVPRLRTKASCRVAIETWNGHYSKAVEMLETVKAACQQLRGSHRLKKVFTLILSIGNTMNKGTSRGNAGGIKIESLSKLWDTKVSRNANTKEAGKTNDSLARVGSVPTAISQCLSKKEVEKKISTLLDFTAVVVHDSEVEKGLSHHSSYLLEELESLQEAVAYLEDGIGDLLIEVDKGFQLLEREFHDMTGMSWSHLDSSNPDSVLNLNIKNSEVFLQEQLEFLKSSYEFLIKAGGARKFLKQEVNVSDQYLKSTVQWLGEINGGGSPKIHLKQLLEFAQHFDQSYQRLKS